MDVGVTGHRPSKIGWGYSYKHPCWVQLKEVFKQELLACGCEKAWTGMALGVDTVFALAVLELKEEGYDIKLCCAIPCQNHSSKWVQESVDLYNKILAKADEVVLVTDAPYKPYLMQKRNEYIVDVVDKIISVWDGSEGGTGNCIKYAIQAFKEIDNIEPVDIERMTLESR